MVVTVRADERSLSRTEQARIARRLRLALEPFQPRVARATARIRRGAEAGGPERSLVQVSVPLGPAGVVRVEVRGARVGSCAESALRRIADAVARRLSSERQQLLEFLFLASGATPAFRPAVRRPAVRRRPRAMATAARLASRGNGAAPRRSAA